MSDVIDFNKYKAKVDSKRIKDEEHISELEYSKTGVYDTGLIISGYKLLLQNVPDKSIHTYYRGGYNAHRYTPKQVSDALYEVLTGDDNEGA